MSLKTGIAWTDATWNPWTGCNKVSAGCQYCYMYRDKRRYGQDPARVVRSGDRTFYAPEQKTRGGVRYKWESGLKVFVCSWSDFLHPDADGWRADAWGVVQRRSELQFQFLTKRPQRWAQSLPEGWEKGWKNCWLGTTCEDQRAFDARVPLLLEVPAALRFVSLEPLLQPINLGDALKGLDWVIVGGESDDRHARLCSPYWIEDIVEQCQAAGVAVFVKQLGTYWAKKHFMPGKGDQMDWWPEALQIQQMPRGIVEKVA